MTLMDFFHEVGKLKKIKRTGWVREGVPHPESVAEHNFRVAIMAMILAKGNMNVEKITKMALFHEIGEAVIGDLVWSRAGITNANVKKEKDEKERAAVRRLCEHFGDKEDVYELWEEFEEGKTPEAKFVKDVDKLEMALQAFEYETEHGKSLDEFYVDAKKYIKDPELLKMLERLISTRK